MTFMPRTLARALKTQAEKYPVLALTGPRQSGKATLLREIFPDYAYVSLENINDRLFAKERARNNIPILAAFFPPCCVTRRLRSPAMRPPCALQDEKTATQNRQVISCTFLRKTIGFLNQYPERAIFDEAQQVPQLFSYIQGRMDERRLMGQYILSESQNFHLAQHITQSLAGRVALFRLLPFDFWEMRQAHALPDTIPRTDTALTGFYPAIFDRGSDPSFFYHNCLQTYLLSSAT
jgi:predicted AAA+ superfamily ATPase